MKIQSQYAGRFASDFAVGRNLREVPIARPCTYNELTDAIDRIRSAACILDLVTCIRHEVPYRNTLLRNRPV